MGRTSIEWTDETWNPARGCSLTSPGCTNCYAMRQAHRFSGVAMPYEGLTRMREQNGPVWTGDVRLVPEALGVPLGWKKPRRVFVNSMSDLFHEALTNEHIAAVFGVMAACPQHTFQVLTKRAGRMREWFAWAARRGEHGRSMFPADDEGWLIRQMLFVSAHRGGAHARLPANHGGPWPLPNVWLGVSVEDQQRADERIPELLRTPAALRWISAEPLLGPVELPWLFKGYCPEHDFSSGLCHGPCPTDRRLGWVVVGGESGTGARTFRLEWARSIVKDCAAASVGCFVKQLGACPTEGDSAELPWWWTGAVGPLGEPRFNDRKGGNPDEWPADLRVREYPKEINHAS